MPSRSLAIRCAAARPAEWAPISTVTNRPASNSAHSGPQAWSSEIATAGKPRDRAAPESCWPLDQHDHRRHGSQDAGEPAAGGGSSCRDPGRLRARARLLVVIWIFPETLEASVSTLYRYDLRLPIIHYCGSSIKHREAVGALPGVPTHYPALGPERAFPRAAKKPGGTSCGDDDAPPARGARRQGRSPGGWSPARRDSCRWAATPSETSTRGARTASPCPNV